MGYEISKIDAAVDQLDWAIRLFLDHEAYIAAITLAGAAEEILGKVLTEQSAHRILMTQLAAKYALSENIVSDQHLNRARNWLKHGTQGTGDEKITLELREEALQMIVRCLTNLVTHDRSLPSEGQRFLEWVSQNRPNACAEQ